jgi:hypothetical protein
MQARVEMAKNGQQLPENDAPVTSGEEFIPPQEQENPDFLEQLGNLKGRHLLNG